jgi:hypothetical protein
MAQLKGMSQLMDALLQQALAKQILIPIQPIKFLPEPKRRNHRTRPSDLRFPKNIRQNRDIKIDLGNGEQSPGARRQRLHSLQDF